MTKSASPLTVTHLVGHSCRVASMVKSVMCLTSGSRAAIAEYKNIRSLHIFWIVCPSQPTLTCSNALIMNLVSIVVDPSYLVSGTSVLLPTLLSYIDRFEGDHHGGAFREHFSCCLIILRGVSIQKPHQLLYPGLNFRYIYVHMQRETSTVGTCMVVPNTQTYHKHGKIVCVLFYMFKASKVYVL